MKLLIVESPAKAKTISKYLDDKYTVRASVGHIRDLPKSSKGAVDIEKGFKPHYVISEGKEKVVAEIKKLAARADEILLATDPDREGEAIAWHVAEAAGLKKPKRVVFHEITKEAVQEAIKHPRDIDENLKEAQEARRVLDRLFGYDLSALVWTKLRYGLSAGRVQSPALRILVEREREIQAFIPEDYWVIKANIEVNKKGLPAGSVAGKIEVTCTEEPKTEKRAKEILDLAKASDWQIKDAEQSEMNRRARAPFTTSTLQQTASSRLGLSPSITMKLAQKLYEEGHITYMRTDSTNLSQLALNEIEQVVKEKYGADYHKRQVYQTKSKNAQEAHEAIRPTHASALSAGKTPEEQRLYRLIWARAVSSQMADAKLAKTKIIAGTKDKDCPDFTANGSQIIFDGWLKVDTGARGEDVELPKVAAGDAATLLDIADEHKQTEPPNRYSEAGLVKELEKRGIGRPSTYASIIKTIVDRGYVDKENKALKPTDTGMTVSGFLEDNFGDYISDTFTAKMEDELDDIALGKQTYVKVLTDFYGPFTKAIGSKKKMEKISNLGEAPKDIKCPTCGGPMVIKLSKSGKFYSCAKFPDCAGALTLEGKEMAGPKETGEMCPECGEKHGGKLIEREGKFGKFISCNRYPKCKYIKKDENLERENSTGVTCPMCKVGMMTQKRGRFGVFYGCSNYPKCKHIIKNKPTGEICNYPRVDAEGKKYNCPHLMMEGTKTIPPRCSDKTCPNHNPHKLEKK